MSIIKFEKHVKPLEKKYNFKDKKERKEIEKIMLDYSIKFDINPNYFESFMPMSPYYLDDKNQPRVVLYTLKPDLFPNINWQKSALLANTEFPLSSEVKEEYLNAFNSFKASLVGFSKVEDLAIEGDYVRLFSIERSKVYTGIISSFPSREFFNIKYYENKYPGDVIELQVGEKVHEFQILDFARKNPMKSLNMPDLLWYFPKEKFSSLEDFSKKMKLKFLLNMIQNAYFHPIYETQVEFVNLNYEIDNFGDLMAVFEMKTGVEDPKNKIIASLINWINSSQKFDLDLNIHTVSIIQDLSNILFETDDRYDEERSFNAFCGMLKLLNISNTEAYKNLIELIDDFTL